MRDMAYVALGSNLGDRDAYLSRARESRWRRCQGVVWSRPIRVEETAPIGPIDQAAFLNQMVALETTSRRAICSTHLLAIEAREGRTRDARWGPRTLDLDIVCLDASTRDEPDLDRSASRATEPRFLAARAGGTARDTDGHTP